MGKTIFHGYVNRNVMVAAIEKKSTTERMKFVELIMRHVYASKRQNPFYL